MTVQYALNTSTIRPASLMEKIRIAGQTGYRGIELWNDDLTAHEQQGGRISPKAPESRASFAAGSASWQSNSGCHRRPR